MFALTIQVQSEKNSSVLLRAHYFGGFVELEFAELTQCAMCPAEKQSSFGQSELSPRLQRHASWTAMIAVHRCHASADVATHSLGFDVENCISEWLRLTMWYRKCATAFSPMSLSMHCIEHAQGSAMISI